MPSLPDFEAFAARMPAVADRSEVLALAASAGPHGVYVANDLDRDPSGRALASRGLAFYGREAILGFAWFGARGNLIVVAAPSARLDARHVADAVAATSHDWRIALAPEEVCQRLAARAATPPVLLRRQLYYVAAPEAVRTRPPDPRVRRANAEDVDALVAASLALNRDDLHLDPARVSRRWLVRTTRERVRAGTAWVLGPAGAPWAKLDVGSDGAAGTVIEGVFTAEAHRGAGHASALVRAINHRHLSAGRPLVCLHVAEDNGAARRCYEKAGMHAAMAVGLLLRNA